MSKRPPSTPVPEVSGRPFTGEASLDLLGNVSRGGEWQRIRGLCFCKAMKYHQSSGLPFHMCASFTSQDWQSYPTTPTCPYALPPFKPRFQNLALEPFGGGRAGSCAAPHRHLQSAVTAQAKNIWEYSGMFAVS